MIIERRMTKNPVVATPEMNIQDAAGLMKKSNIHRLPVLDRNGKLVGVISEKDVLKASPSSVSTLSAHEMNYLMSKVTVKMLMNRNPITISKDTTVEEAAHLMADYDLSCLPVTEEGKLIGIISKSDMFKMLLELFGSREFGARISFICENKPGVVAKITQAMSEKNMDIISLGVLEGTDESNAIITLKVKGFPSSAVVDTIKPFVQQIIDVREV